MIAAAATGGRPAMTRAIAANVATATFRPRRADRRGAAPGVSQRPLGLSKPRDILVSRPGSGAGRGAHHPGRRRLIDTGGGATTLTGPSAAPPGGNREGGGRFAARGRCRVARALPDLGPGNVRVSNRSGGPAASNSRPGSPGGSGAKGPSVGGKAGRRHIPSGPRRVEGAEFPGDAVRSSGASRSVGDLVRSGSPGGPRRTPGSRASGRSGFLARARATTGRSGSGRSSRSGAPKRWPAVTAAALPSNGSRPARSWQ